MGSAFLDFLDEKPEQQEEAPAIVEPTPVETVEPAPSSGGFLDYLESDPVTAEPSDPLPQPSVEQVMPDDMPVSEDPDISPELMRLVDEAYGRTSEYFTGVADEQDLDGMFEQIKLERAEKEKLLQERIDAGMFTREEALAKLRTTDPNSILLKSDEEALVDLMDKLFMSTPDDQRNTMIDYLKSENAVTRRVAEQTLRSMGNSTLGAMNGVVFTDEMLNPVTSLADVPMYARGAKTAIEEGRYLDAAGNVVGGVLAAAPAGVIAKKGVKKIGKHVFKSEEEALEIARRYNYGGADLAARENAEEARKRAAEAAAANADVAEELIKAFETKTGKTISTTDADGRLVMDFEKAKEAGRETALEVTGDLLDVAGTDIEKAITSPILDPNKFDSIVAVAAELKKKKPDAFDNKKTIIQNLFEYTVKGDLVGGQELIDMLHKYNMTFEDYVLTVVGSGSDAGKILGAFSQIRRKQPRSIQTANEAGKKAREANDFRKGVMRIENVRRGGLVSQIATAARNLTSGAIRAPMESLGNVMDQAIYTMQNDGVLSGVEELLSGNTWRESFSNMKYMFSRPDVAKGYSDLILKHPDMEKQFDAMFNNINEIQALTGRGTGSTFDKVITPVEDFVDFINTPNRWQEYLIRRGQFFGELERLTKREYNIDLIDTLNEGKLQDLISDASTVVPEGKESFISLVDKATNKALDVTYAKQPEIGLFRETSSWITRNGLTVAVPFPRFMFNSMELMGQYAGGASIPLARKVASIVRKDLRGPLTDKDRQRISRNLMGMAAVGAAYMYRTSEGVPPEYNQIAIGDQGQADSTPTYPMAHFLYAGEAVKKLQEGTFDDWFDAREFQELFAGVNLRTGVGNSILEEMGAIADGTDLVSAERTGRAIGRTVGNYLSTWAVPFAQVIDAERATGLRQSDFRNVAQDPELSLFGTMGKEIKRTFQQRGFFLSPEEEAELPRKEYPFYPEGKSRLYPESKFLGATITNRPSADGEYLMNLGYDWRDFGSRSKVPSVQAFEQQKINEFMPALVDMAEALRPSIMMRYYETPSLREEYEPQEYFAGQVRPEITKMLRKFKTKIADGKIAQGDPYARVLTKYRRVQPDLRKAATQEFTRITGSPPDPLEAEDLQKLILISQRIRQR